MSEWRFGGQQFQLIGERFPMSLNKKYVVAQPYRTELPDFLISIIDLIIKQDPLHVLRADFLHLSLEELVYHPQDTPETLWLFADPRSNGHLISRAPHPLFPVRPPLNSSLDTHQLTRITETQLAVLQPTCNNILANRLQGDRVEDIRKTRVISIDHIRARCEANIYTSGLELEIDLKQLIAWNQLFRATSLNSFSYLSALYEKIINIINKKDLERKCHEIKTADLARLMRYELNFKINTTRWPFVPTSFRDYEHIQHYEPTPPQRTQHIYQRLRSQKQPVQCPQDCVCLAQQLGQGQFFCRFSLAHGWQTQCPNRAKKIECNHARQEDQNRCRNSEIRKHLRKKCAGKLLSEGQESQIEEKLTWGIDLFTRNVIYNCLPELDIQNGVIRQNNQVNRSHFIQKTLAKAMNFMGENGFDLIATCNYIKIHSASPFNTQSTSKEPLNQDKIIDQKQQTFINEETDKIFTERDYLYADTLMKNYEVAIDKTGFRIHTKGKGAICIDRAGIRQGDFIVEYFGEIYEPWRWYDRQDFIKEICKKRKLKNFTPQFYNIYLQKHLDEPLGYDMLIVDPSRKGNFSSRFSHSCDPNCGTIITVSEGKYYIGMYCFRDIEYGEELTFDYCSMTESNQEHLNSICLCGMKKCRGNYLQLSTAKAFNNLMDNKNCFFTRNSAILKSVGDITKEELEICYKNNIKEGLIQGTPNWIVKWMARVLTFIEIQGQVHKQALIDQWRKVYPWDNSESQAQKQQKRQLYSQTNKQDLITLRTQNLTTSVDKLKYFFSRNESNQNPPIFIEGPQKIISVLITKQDSVLLELQENLIKYKCESLAQLIQNFIDQINHRQQASQKLFLFRLCCLVISHALLFLVEPTFSYDLLSDIIFFYAFTHTYFSPNEYKSFQADEIAVALSEITGERGYPNERKEKSKKKYASPFVWGQMASWYKQTIVCPEASLSQDRRGTLSYPLIKSIMKSEYPYEKTSRSAFMKVLLEKPASSWPPASGCQLSFKNPYKLYGTLLFENVHSKQKLEQNLPKESLLQSCLSVMNSSLRIKLQLFVQVEYLLEDIPKQSEMYDILKGFQLDMDSNVPLIVRNANKQLSGEPRKQVKQDYDDEQ